MNNQLVEVKEFDFSPIETSDLAASTKRKYKKAIENYLATGHGLNDVEAMIEHAHGLSMSSRWHLKSALKLLTKRANLQARASATPENIDQVRALIYRLEALEDSIETEQVESKKLGKWISAKQVLEIYEQCELVRDENMSMRDLVLFKLLFKTGARREEVCKMKFADLTRRPINGKTVDVIHINGKGNRDRYISLDKETVELLNRWRDKVKYHQPNDDVIIQRIKRGGIISGEVNPGSLYFIVKKYGKLIGEPELSPHDTRRTFAELLRQGGFTIEIISRLLGHQSVETTMDYLNLDDDTIRYCPGKIIP